MPRKNPPRVRGYRKPEQLASGRWRGWVYRRDIGKRNIGTWPTFEAANSTMQLAQTKLDNGATLEEALTAAGLAAKTTANKGEHGATNRRFSIYVAEWAATASGARQTRQGRKNVAATFAAQWPRAAVDEITPADVRRYVASLEENGLASGTIRHRVSMLRSCMKAAITDGLRGDDPTQAVKLGPWTPSKAKRVPTDDEVERAMAALPYYLRPAVLLARDSGLRVSEIGALRWRCLDLTGEYNGGIPAVQVGPILCRDNTEQPHPKGKRILWVPLSARTVTALADLFATHPSITDPEQHVFREQRNQGRRTATGTFNTLGGEYGGERMRYQRFEYLWQKACTHAGLHAPLPGWHALRHGLGHDLHRQEAPAQVIQMVLRHGNLATTRQYMPDVSIQQAARWTGKLHVVPDTAAAG
jgi:integrase